ncbi:Thymidylate kinase [Elasticomyces elasticus]|uniref:dTMP kinase n=1 Tax=Exophiala sideris TaxID=1016849 RepID=A0ABR0JNL7_9EURO|nr:Thymidylate kinase [Elasticomyces elasticus]KAK5038088.1 Thymidylate kinase [Exophiala sideris]KAK5044071.1 Thymidylate kinase [Exophiala sideris]KAK5067571.1 Thymidylate kinase [Exophiala sideris]KAK5184190.1 Thymidylate kinase [Eurotiomycetes sp. CCFEE 6388]
METARSTAIFRGHLVVIEGLDRSGKSSQCQLLLETIQASRQRARYVKFPDRTTPTGQMINSYLTGQAQQDDHSIHLLFSANRWEAIKGIEEDLMNGFTVIVDRYSFSGAVYSAAKENPDLSLDWAWYPEIGLLKPDILFFLDISSADAAKRGGYGAERYETERMQARVRTLFTELFQRLDNVHVRVIDAGRSIQEVHQAILEGVDELPWDQPLDMTLGKLGPLLDIA